MICPDCGALTRDDHIAVTSCRYVELHAETMRRDGRSEADIDAMRSSGFDPPCIGRAYDWGQAQRESGCGFWVFLALIVIICVASALLLLS